MVAVAVLMVAVLGTLASQVASVNLLRTSRETGTAMMDLRAAMDELLVQPHGSIPAAAGSFAPGTPIVAFTDLHLPNETIVPTYPGYVVGGVIPDPLEIILTITWDDYAKRQRTLTLASMKTQ